jgi:outer membrane autotransporter protein
MSPVIDSLNSLSGAALSNAISQTLPVLVGGASQATYNTQRALQQTAMARLDNIRGMASGEYFATERSIWVKPFGSIANQSAINNVPGYRTSGGGLAVGIDGNISDNAWLGGVLAYSYSTISGSSDPASSSLGINSFQLGVYGAYALQHDTDLAYQADFGVNQNRANRSIGFMNTGAQANYTSYTSHIGVGVSKVLPVASQINLLPSLRIDYAAVSADAYQESGAAYGLNLNVSSQLYQELLLTAGITGDFQLSDKVRLTANAGVGYNTLNTQTQITASFSGGGESFVTAGLNVSPWLYSAGLGVVVLQNNDVDLSARYDGQASPTGYLNQMASIRLSVRY